MTLAIPWLFVTTSFLLATWSVFSGLLITTTDQNDALREANEFREERLATLISITSTGTSDCKYTTALRNRSRGVSFGDFSEIDFLVSYDLTTGDSTRRLAYTSEWTVSSITGDNTNPNVWDPEETATFSFSLAPEPKVGTKGTIAVAVPGSISDSAYFDVVTCFYWHNDPTPPTGDTASHALLSMDRIAPLASTLYNYDTDRDTDPGLQLKRARGVSLRPTHSSTRSGERRRSGTLSLSQGMCP